jgi:preprotein translocase subunit SecG
MQFFIGFLYVLEVLVSLLLGGIILLQKPKDGGLGVSFGGGMGESLFGGAQMGNILTKGTVILAAVFLLNTLILSRLTSSSGKSVMEGVRTPAASASEALPFPGNQGGAPAAPAPMPPAGL